MFFNHTVQYEHTKIFITVFCLSFSLSIGAKSIYENKGNTTQGTHNDGSTSKSITIGDTTTIEHHGKKGTYVKQGKFTTYTDQNGNKTQYHQIGDTIYGKDHNGLDIVITKNGNQTFIKRSDGQSVVCTHQKNITNCKNN